MITDEPSLAREVLAGRVEMRSTKRLMVSVVLKHSDRLLARIGFSDDDDVVHHHKSGYMATQYIRALIATAGATTGTDRHQWLWNQLADGCQPASAHNSPLTAELVMRKQIASAISSGLIRRPNWVSGRM